MIPSPTYILAFFTENNIIEYLKEKISYTSFMFMLTEMLAINSERQSILLSAVKVS